MNKVLILDDRIERKKTHMNDAAIKQLSFCVSNGWLNTITGEGVEKDMSFQYCSDYSLLAFHKSWLDSNNLLSEIERYAKENRKLLIIFSGGISQILLLNDYKYLRVNSADFYTGRLPGFIEKYVKSEVEQPLLELLYGKGWLIPLYMKYRQLLWNGATEENDAFLEFELNYGKYLEQFKALTPIEMLNKLDESISNEIIKLNAL